MEVFRAVYPRDVKKMYEAWISVSALLLRDANAGAKEVADELARVLEVETTAGLDLLASSFKIAKLLADEVAVGDQKLARGA